MADLNSEVLVSGDSNVLDNVQNDILPIGWEVFATIISVFFFKYLFNFLGKDKDIEIEKLKLEQSQAMLEEKRVYTQSCLDITKENVSITKYLIDIAILEGSKKYDK